MIPMKASEIANMVNGRILAGDENAVVEEFIINSREVKPGTGFVALKGEVTDGHRFIPNAYEGGASLIMVSDVEQTEEYAKDILAEGNCCFVCVDDTLWALQELSGKYLEKMNMRSIAVTGSVGKTTTRDMLYAAVSAAYRTGTNKKNYNSETGLPLTLLSFSTDMEIGVLEMGMDAPGQIERLVEISNPEAAIITNIGISHISRLGSRENIMKAKMEVTSGFDAQNTLIVNSDDDMLAKLENETLPYKLIKVGTDSTQNPDYLIDEIKDFGIKGISFRLKSRDWSEVIELPVPGEHNGLNAGLAVAGAVLMGVDYKTAIEGLKNMKTTGSRMKVSYIEPGPGEEIITVIDDAYNAAPASMKSALKMLSNTEGKRRIAILGGINELGELSEIQHREVGHYLADCNPDMLITIGEMAKWIEEGAREKGASQNTTFEHFDTKEELYPVIKELLMPGDIVLLKASRSYELDEIERKLNELY